MTNNQKILILCFFILLNNNLLAQDFIRVNQLGYTPKAEKNAVYLSREKIELRQFEVCDAFTETPVMTSKNILASAAYGNFASTFRLNFSKLNTSGIYYLKVNGVKSPLFKVSDYIYDGLAEIPLQYLRLQRCGYNPVQNAECHIEDGFVVDNPQQQNLRFDVTGGWHNASEQIKSVSLNAMTVIYLLFAYENNPKLFHDFYQSDGKRGANGIPDILDEAKWGLDWLIKMHPNKNELYHQVGDDRDRRKQHLPTNDETAYSQNGRPVYFCSGKPQGQGKIHNKSNGMASVAGKISAAFSYGAMLLEGFFPQYAAQLKHLAVSSYKLGKKYPGVCQDVPYESELYSKEQNWLDDMELAAILLYKAGNKKYLNDAIQFGRKEPVNPWMGQDSIAYREQYPFFNPAHYFIITDTDSALRREFLYKMKGGIDVVDKNHTKNPFHVGIPFVHFSNHMALSALMQIDLYYSIKPGGQFKNCRASLNDWLFGCNPWGINMLSGLQNAGVSPKSICSAYSYSGIDVKGAFVNGAVMQSVMDNFKYLIPQKDNFKLFQSSKAIYHDNSRDYITNQASIDGTAMMLAYLSLVDKGSTNFQTCKKCLRQQKVLTCENSSEKMIYLIFTSDKEDLSGYETIKNTLKKQRKKASFFFTNNCLKNEKTKRIGAELNADGHYIGIALNEAIGQNSSPKKTMETVKEQLKQSFKTFEELKIPRANTKILLKPQNKYNADIINQFADMKLDLFAPTPGTAIYYDNFPPKNKLNHLTGEQIYSNILNWEKSIGLNGHFFVMRLDKDEEKEDKFYPHLENLIKELEKRGYTFGIFQ